MSTTMKEERRARGRNLKARAARRRKVIVAGYLAGKRLFQIAREAGCHFSWVSMVARREGCKPRYTYTLSGEALRERVKSYTR
jgi:hypothetical protein